MNDDDLKDQINELIRDEIQDVINEYVDTRDSTKQGGLGFISNDDEGEFKVSIKNDEVNKLIKEYKNCLLYTSPSPRDKRQSRMPSSA